MSIGYVPKVDKETGEILPARPVVVCGKSMTKQSFRDQVNINKILARHRKTGMLDHVNGKTPFYGDVSGLVSYQDSLNVIQQANDLFSGMSSDVRARFKNDPIEMIKFFQDEKNIEEAIKLGMCVKRPVDPKDGPTPGSGTSTPKEPK